jgi:hypothetical protein
MYDKPMLSLDQVRKAMDAMLGPVPHILKQDLCLLRQDLCQTGP